MCVCVYVCMFAATLESIKWQLGKSNNFFDLALRRVGEGEVNTRLEHTLDHEVVIGRERERSE